MRQSRGFPGIEVLRFVCAIGVLIYHYQHFLFVGAYHDEIGERLRPTLPLYSVFSVFYNNGPLAVQFFWVISGYIFYWSYAESIGDRRTTFAEFAVRRFSRLYPLHIATLLLVAAGQWLYFRAHGVPFIYSWNKPVAFVAQVLFASNWFSRQFLSFNGPIWSVSVEILIYLGFFVVARMFRASTVAAALLAALFALPYNFLHGPINREVFSCGMYFFAGGVAQRLSAWRMAPLVAGASTAALLGCLELGYLTDSTWVVLPLAVAVVVLMAFAAEVRLLSGVVRRLAFLGNATYSSYLIHFPLQLLLVLSVDALGWRRSLFLQPLAFLGFIAITISAGLLIYSHYEVPMQERIRNRLRALIAPPRVSRVAVPLTIADFFETKG